MRLTQVNFSPPFSTFCCRCGVKLRIEENHPPVYADLDGKEFVDYYCTECAATEAKLRGFSAT